jgi:hypothetical protein
MRRVSFHRRSAALALLLGLSPLVSQAETLNCTPVTSLPATLSTQGIYCLTGNVATAQTSGHAIEITANNVTLDLNGWKVGGQAAGTGTTAVGIYSTAANVTIRNGIVRGFFTGMRLEGRGATVQGITADQNTAAGIVVTGAGSIVQGNQVVDTGGTTAVANNNATGIAANGSGSVVQNNLVSGLTPVGTGTAVGIYFDSTATQSAARTNIVSESVRPAGAANGVWINGASAVAVSNNIVTNFVFCVRYTNAATGTYSRNTAISCDTSYSGGTAGVGND